MTSEQLAEEVARQVERCTSRVLGVGRAQYDDGRGQKFERITVNQLFDEMFEELDDVIVYAVMARIRLQKALARLKKHDFLGGI